MLDAGCWMKFGWMDDCMNGWMKKDKGVCCLSVVGRLVVVCVLCSGLKLPSTYCLNWQSQNQSLLISNVEHRISNNESSAFILRSMLDIHYSMFDIRNSFPLWVELRTKSLLPTGHSFLLIFSFFAQLPLVCNDFCINKKDKFFRNICGVVGETFYVAS